MNDIVRELYDFIKFDACQKLCICFLINGLLTEKDIERRLAMKNNVSILKKSNIVQNGFQTRSSKQKTNLTSSNSTVCH